MKRPEQKPREPREAYLRRVLEWMKDTVLLFGGTEYTAYICAAYFAQGVRASWGEKSSDKPCPES